MQEPVGSFRKSEDSRRALEFFAEIFEDRVADAGADYGDGEVGRRDDVLERERERLPLPIDAGELAHEEIGIEEKDDKSDLDEGTPEWLEPWRRRERCHEFDDNGEVARAKAISDGRDVPARPESRANGAKPIIFL